MSIDILLTTPVAYISPDNHKSHIIGAEGSKVFWSTFDRQRDNAENFPIKVVGNLTDEGISGKIHHIIQKLESDGYLPFNMADHYK